MEVTALYLLANGGAVGKFSMVGQLNLTFLVVQMPRMLIHVADADGQSCYNQRVSLIILARRSFALD